MLTLRTKIDGGGTRLRMGVDHGGLGDKPPAFGVGDVNANCSPQILSWGTKRNVLCPSKYAKIRFRPLPRTLLRELTRFPEHPIRLGRGHPPIPYSTRHRPTFGARHASPRIPATVPAYTELFLHYALISLNLCMFLRACHLQQ